MVVVATVAMVAVPVVVVESDDRSSQECQILKYRGLSLVSRTRTATARCCPMPSPLYLQPIRSRSGHRFFRPFPASYTVRPRSLFTPFPPSRRRYFVSSGFPARGISRHPRAENHRVSRCFLSYAISNDHYAVVRRRLLSPARRRL